MSTSLRPATIPCQVAPVFFHAADDERLNSEEYNDRIANAKSLCAGCPIKDECRQLGRDLHEVGIWGGETDEERRAAGYQPRGFRSSDIIPACGTEAGAKRHRRRGGTPCPPCLRAEAAGRRRRELKSAA